MRRRQSGAATSGAGPTDRRVVGLDLGTTAVRAVELAPASDGGEQPVALGVLGSVSLPEGTIVDGAVHDPASLTSALQVLWRTNGFSCRQVVIGVSNPQVLVRDLTMPRLTPEQQAKALPYRAREVVALPLDQAVLDFRPLGPAPDDPDSVAGLLIAAPREPVLAAARAVEAAGLRVVRVDLASFAVLRASAAAGVESEAVVDIGAAMTTVVIHRYGVPRVVRTLARGGQHLTERLVDRTGASQNEAELRKREEGLLGGDPETAMILTTAVRPLITDVRGSVQYFSTTNDGALVQRISLTGGGAQLPGLAEVLGDDVGVPTAVVSPLRHVRRPAPVSPELADELEPATSAVAVGLAMGVAA